jgi:hypothetical protein
LPGGIFRQELKNLWIKTLNEDLGAENHIKTLMNRSLLQLKEQAGDLGLK